MENGSKSAIIAAVVVLIAIGGGTAYLLTREDETTTESNPTSQVNNEEEVVAPEPTQNIVEIAAGDENFSTLVTAVTAASLVDALSDASKSYTVFAPTNAAFNKLPAGTVDTLVKPESKDTLTGILTYHVVDSAVLSSQLSNGQVIKTLNGGNLTVEITDGMVFIVDAKGGKAKVTTADIKATNGVVHVIDAVLMP